VGFQVYRNSRRSICIGVVSCFVFFTPGTSFAGTLRCPDSRDIPQLTLRGETQGPLPTIDKWQVYFEGVPLSDSQVALLSGNQRSIDLSYSRLDRRGARVYWGLASSALGLAVSSTGWVLYGQNSISREVTLSMALGGLIVGVVGVLFITETIQRSVEPFLAPTPSHVISRDEMKRLVEGINYRFYNTICDASDKAWRVEPGGTSSLVPNLRRPAFLGGGDEESRFVNRTNK